MKKKYGLRVRDLTLGDHKDFESLKRELGIRNNADAVRYLVHERKGVRGLWYEMKQEWNISTLAMDKLIVPKFNSKAKGLVAGILSAGSSFFYGWSKEKREAYKQFLMSDMAPDEIHGAMIHMDELMELGE
jgi:hypothetical protein